MSRGRPTTLITGATRGIGEETARELSARGHALIIAARDTKRARELAHELPGGADVYEADLASLASVRRLAEEVRARDGSLDVLINNAGIMKRRREVTDEGFEVTWVVNHLAPFLLGALLLDRLEPGSGRLVNVNSEGHRAALASSRPVAIDFDNLQGEHDYNVFRAYSQAKLANLMTTYELARRAPRLAVNAIHPGVIKTDLGRELPRIVTAPFHAMLSRPPIEGARAVVEVATGLEAADVTGRYFDGVNAVHSSQASYDRAVGERLWSLTCEMVGLPSTLALT